MDDAYAVLEDAAARFDRFAVELEGLGHRLDQYAAATEGDADLPPEIADEAEMREEIAAYFRDTLPHAREIAAWAYDDVDDLVDELYTELQQPREAGLTPETFERKREAYNDAHTALNGYLDLLHLYGEMDQRAADLIGPEVVAQAKEDAPDIPAEPETRQVAVDDGDSGTAVPVQNGSTGTREQSRNTESTAKDLLDGINGRQAAAAAAGAAALGAAYLLGRRDS